MYNRHYEKFADGRVKDIEDEIPFAVPEGWAWCRLGEVCSFLNGFAFNSKEFKNTGIPIIRISNIAYEKVDISNCVYSSELLHEDFVAKKGDLLVALSGATTGKMGIYGEEQKAYINQRVGNIRIVVNNTIIPEYRNFFLYSQSKKILTKAYGGAQPNIGGKDILEILLPLPPLAEQKRIVTAIETIFTQIDILEQNQADLQTAVKQAKSKILDLAIHGKLVKQDPADEPASVMLGKLRAEKEAKIAAGEIKRGKNDSYIYRSAADNCYYEKFDGKSDVCIDNEIPFELPANWYWQKGKEIFCHMTTKIPSGHNFRYIDIDAIDNKTHRIRCSKLIEVSKAPSRASREVQNGDILFSLVRPYLRNIALVLENYSDCIASTGFYVCRPNKTLISKYAFYMMTSQYVVNGLNKFMKGDNSPSITGDNIIKWLYPLPPISEQKRIVTRIGEIFNVLDDIQRDLI